MVRGGCSLLRDLAQKTVVTTQLAVDGAQYIMEWRVGVVWRDTLHGDTHSIERVELAVDANGGENALVCAV